MTIYTPEQQAEHRKLWVEALRSGKYQQAVKALRNVATNGMCCLGVACDISGLGKWDGASYVTQHDKDALALPVDVQAWLGLDEEEGKFDTAHRFHPQANALSGINDQGLSFAVIADIIESEPPGLIVSGTDEAAKA